MCGTNVINEENIVNINISLDIDILFTTYSSREVFCSCKHL